MLKNVKKQNKKLNKINIQFNFVFKKYKSTDYQYFYNIPNSNFASSLIISFVQAGSKVISTLALTMPS